GHLGRLADPSAGGGPGVRGEHAGPGVGGGPAGVRPRPQSLGRGGVGSLEECRVAQRRVARPGGVGAGGLSRHRATATQASSGPFLLCTGWVEAPRNLIVFAQRSVGCVFQGDRGRKVPVLTLLGNLRVNSERSRTNSLSPPEA